MWYDTVGHGHVPAPKCAIDSFGAARLVLGTDFPYENDDTFLRAVNYRRLKPPTLKTPRLTPAPSSPSSTRTPARYSASEAGTSLP